VAIESVRLLMADKASTFAIMAQVLRIDDQESEYSYQNHARGLGRSFPTESIVNVLKTMSYEDPPFLIHPAV
jgi:hypothetical protein